MIQWACTRSVGLFIWSFSHIVFDRQSQRFKRPNPCYGVTWAILVTWQVCFNRLKQTCHVTRTRDGSMLTAHVRYTGPCYGVTWVWPFETLCSAIKNDFYYRWKLQSVRFYYYSQNYNYIFSQRKLRCGKDCLLERFWGTWDSHNLWAYVEQWF